MNRKLAAGVFILVVAFFTWAFRPRPSAAPLASVGAKAQAQKQAPSALLAPSAPPAPAAAASNSRPPLRVPAASVDFPSRVDQQRLRDLLMRYSNDQNWSIEIGPDGRPTRLRGASLDVMKPGPRTDAFLQDLTRELGFVVEPKFERKVSATGNFDLVDFKQSQVLNDGRELPVFEAWLRLKGRVEEGASLVNNFLKPLATLPRADVSLSEDEALAIARRDFGGNPEATFNLISGDVIYADDGSPQVATRISVEGPLPHWLILVGHESRSVLHRQVSTRE